jgi:hypothetical protein
VYGTAFGAVRLVPGITIDSMRGPESPYHSQSLIDI